MTLISRFCHWHDYLVMYSMIFTVVTDVSEILLNKLTGWWESFVAMLPNIVTALIVLTVGWFLVRLLRSLTVKTLKRLNRSELVIKIVNQLVYASGLIIVCFTVLHILHLDKTVTSLLAGAGVLGLALSFAFSNTAANLMAGIILASKKPFRVNDIIEVTGLIGVVKQIGLRSTMLKKFDGTQLLIPNKEIIENEFINHTIRGERRIELEVGVAYNSDLEKVEELACEAIRGMGSVRDDREILFSYDQFDDSSINFIVRFWPKNIDQPSYLRCKGEAIKAIKKKFDEHDVNIPFPIRTLKLAEREKEVLMGIGSEPYKVGVS